MSLETDLLASISENSWEAMLKRAGPVFVAGKDLQEILHLLSTAHSYVCEFITNTLMGQHKCKANNVSLCTMVEYLPFHKGQIQLVTSPDTEIPRKRTGADLPRQGRDQI